jgi:hypothetical protein
MGKGKDFLLKEMDRLWEECILVIHPEAEKEYQVSEANKEIWHGYSTKNFGFMESLNVFFWEGEADLPRGRFDMDIPKFQLVINIWDSYSDENQALIQMSTTKGVPSEWRKKYIALFGLMLAKGFDDVWILHDDSCSTNETLVEGLQYLIQRIVNGDED